MHPIAPVAIRRALALILAAITCAACALRADDDDAPPVVAPVTVDSPITLADDGNTWTLANGLVKISVLKSSGKLLSIVYRGRELIYHTEGWEQYPSGDLSQSVTIDPAQNDGQRAEVSVKGVNGRMDLEVRYAVERGSSGFFTYAIYSHGADYPAAGEGESRFISELIPTFDWLSVDADRNMPMCSNRDEANGVVVHAKEQRILSTGLYKNSVEHKYNYCAQMYLLPAYGWSSIHDHIGIWMINPSNEYLGGGPTRIDLVCHMGATMLDYWTSGHYAGGAECNIPAGEVWNKVVGPIFVYCNSLQSYQTPSSADLDTFAATAGNPTVPPAWTNNANALFQNALNVAKTVEAQWPFDWVSGVDYPQKSGRATVTGRLVLHDPQAATTKLPHLNVGLAHPDYTGPGTPFALRGGNGLTMTWAHDANYYQFWTVGADNGTFTISNVRPGNYTLHAFADGVLGEFAQTNITVAAGQSLDLGNLTWSPVRYGTQLWEIGYPDRTAGKFFKGDGADYWLWGWNMRYALLFPDDLTYTIGKSDYHKDWFFEEVPHATNLSFVNPDAKDPANQRFGWVKAQSLSEYPQTDQTGPWRLWGRGRATTWTIKFDMDQTPEGYAALRLALAGADGPNGLVIGVNGHTVGTIHPTATNAIRYNTDRGMWQERTQTFDASLLHPGENQITLTVPAGDLENGVIYDYLRLELNQAYHLDGTPIPPPDKS